jgi:hypothetical protein
MRAKELWIEPDAGNPFRKESRVLPCRHALTEAASTWEEKFAPALAGGFQVIVDSVTGLIRRLELDRPTRLFLPNRCAIHRIAVSCNASTLIATTSQPRSLLSTAKLKGARSRIRPCNTNRVLIDQTCFGRSGV